MPEDTTQTNPPDAGAKPAPEANVEAEGLGDGGRRALAGEREARKTAEREAREARERLAKLEGEEMRRKVASEKNLTPEQARFLDGADEEAMGARADELLEAFKPDEGDARHRPRERLRSGAAPSAEPRDIGKVADDVLRG